MRVPWVFGTINELIGSPLTKRMLVKYIFITMMNNLKSWQLKLIIKLLVEYLAAVQLIWLIKKMVSLNIHQLLRQMVLHQ